MRIANNVIALNINNNMSKTDRKLAISMGRLSSGLKINKAKDDSAGYAIATRFDMQVQGYNRGSENALDGISLIQTAEGYQEAIHEMLQRCRELSVQAANGTNSDSDMRIINDEINELTDEINAITKKATFNGIGLLDGSAQRLAKDAAPDKSRITYVTDDLPDGTLNYTVSAIGKPAVYDTSYDGTNAVSKSGTITINGSTVNFEKDEDPAVTYSKILQACDDNNLSFDASSGRFTTLEAGSKHSITVSGDATILADLGIPATPNPTNVIGSDAVVTVDSFIKKSDGSVDASYLPTIIADGNKVSLISLNNQEIDIEVIDKDPITGLYYEDPATTGMSFSTSSELTPEGKVNIQLGGTVNAVLAITIPKIDTKTLGIDYINVSTVEGASKAIADLDIAISKVSKSRANLGAYQNRLEFSSDSLIVASNSTTGSLSRIRDTDIAREMTEYTKENVSFQAATAILAQANQRPQLILQLIR